MALQPEKHEIDHHIMKLIVGVIALTLANLTAFFASSPLDSISASYHEPGWPRDIFVGFLFAISAFLLAYNGYGGTEMVLSKVAAVAALGVAIFPCQCKTHDEIIPYLHAISAAVMFLILAVFCWFFYQRAREKRQRRADWRAWIYLVCGVVIVVAVVVLILDDLMGGPIQKSVPRLVFYGERAGLVAFGISWLVASRVLPVLTAPEERVSLLPKGGKT